MKKEELTSANIGKQVIFKDDVYIKAKREYYELTIKGIIESLLIDINFGAYGYRVRSEYGDHNFILKDNHPALKNLIGRDLKEIILYL
jgi:hypothetical protein